MLFRSFIGNSLEIIESIDILQAKGPQDSTDLTIELGAEMLLLAKKVNSLEEGRKKIAKSLSDGSAFNKFVEMIAAQGGDTSFIKNTSKFTRAAKKIVINADKKGFIGSMDCESLGIASCMLGGGRNNLADIIDMSVGIEMHKKVGDQVDINEPILTIYANEKGVEEAITKAKNAVHIKNTMVNKPILCLDRISTL